MKLKKILAGHLLALALVFPYTVFAEDFTLNVKVNLGNMHPDVTHINVFCKVANGYDNVATNSNLIGSKKSNNFKLSADGAINTTVQVKFNADPGKNPPDATNYRCLLNLIIITGTEINPIPSVNNLCNNPDNDWRCPLAGKPFKEILDGTIP